MQSPGIMLSGTLMHVFLLARSPATSSREMVKIPLPILADLASKMAVARRVARRQHEELPY
jgi:hypothetical protein